MALTIYVFLLIDGSFRVDIMFNKAYTVKDLNTQQTSCQKKKKRKRKKSEIKTLTWIDSFLAKCDSDFGEAGNFLRCLDRLVQQFVCWYHFAHQSCSQTRN